jgi:chemotaxis protein histidine kinase CheA
MTKAKEDGAGPAPEIEELPGDQGASDASAESEGVEPEDQGEFDAAYAEIEGADAAGKEKSAPAAKPDGEGEGETNADDNETAMARLEKLAAAEDPAPPADAGKSTPPPAKQPTPAPAAEQKSVALTLDAVLDSFDKDEKEGVSDFLNDFPELKKLMAKVLEKATGQAAPAKPQEAPPAAAAEQKPAEDAAASAASEEAERLGLLVACEKKLPGSIVIVESKDFQEWIGKQSAGIQKLANSGDVETSVTIIQAFKETRAKTAAGEVDKAKAEARQKAAALHKSTAKPGTAKPRAAAGGTGADEFGDAFDEFAKGTIE